MATAALALLDDSLALLTPTRQTTPTTHTHTSTHAHTPPDAPPHPASDSLAPHSEGQSNMKRVGGKVREGGGDGSRSGGGGEGKKVWSGETGGGGFSQDATAQTAATAGGVSGWRGEAGLRWREGVGGDLEGREEGKVAGGGVETRVGSEATAAKLEEMQASIARLQVAVEEIARLVVRGGAAAASAAGPAAAAPAAAAAAAPAAVAAAPALASDMPGAASASMASATPRRASVLMHPTAGVPVVGVGKEVEAEAGVRLAATSADIRRLSDKVAEIRKSVSPQASGEGYAAN
jgi:hypothetical protein